MSLEKDIDRALEACHGNYGDDAPWMLSLMTMEAVPKRLKTWKVVGYRIMLDTLKKAMALAKTKGYGACECEPPAPPKHMPYYRWICEADQRGKYPPRLKIVATAGHDS